MNLSIFKDDIILTINHVIHLSNKLKIIMAIHYLNYI